MNPWDWIGVVAGWAVLIVVALVALLVIIMLVWIIVELLKPKKRGAVIFRGRDGH